MLQHFEKIILTGPESSGKTILANQLAGKFSLPLIKEYAREYLQTIHGKYTIEDVMHIAQKQAEQLQIINTQNTIIYDTDLLTSIIWLKDKFNTSISDFEKIWMKKFNSIYFLCKPDIVWQYDPLREDQDRRDYLYNIHLEYLKAGNKVYYEIGGNPEERLDMVSRILFQSVV